MYAHVCARVCDFHGALRHYVRRGNFLNEINDVAMSGITSDYVRLRPTSLTM